MASPRPSDEPVSATRDETDALSTLHTRILDFEREWWRHVGAKEEAIREEFGLSAPRYYQVLNTLISSPAAVRYDPMLVGRLQRVRDTRTQARASRTFPTSPTDPIE